MRIRNYFFIGITFVIIAIISYVTDVKSLGDVSSGVGVLSLMFGMLMGVLRIYKIEE